MKKLITTISLSTMLIATSAMAQSNPELNQIFNTTHIENVQALELSHQEMKDTQGAVVNFAIGGALGLGGYALDRQLRNQPWSWQGAITSTAIGAATSGVGAIGARAAGGGIAGAVSWKAPAFATGQILQQIPRNR